MKKLVVLLFCCMSFSVFAQTETDRQAVLKALEKQRMDWNSGNIEAYMQGYLNSDSLLFVGKNGPTYGWQKTLDNYKKGYPDTAHMGKFTSTIISLKKLSVEYYFVTGKWFLKRSVGDATGYYTLLLRKIKGKWVVVADHSS